MNGTAVRDSHVLQNRNRLREYCRRLGHGSSFGGGDGGVMSRYNRLRDR
ncbi:hypothetical protein LAL4801_00680 [Roseibium aggregatum]|uniref:Uncharacterized protein n=1 Tax=Roseibium aggregatum TaxID=187304 RepID=A0A0M6XWN4_9HYPH|nr:hypothetical protein LAL4801_00680 [Roseibium aggregatum]